MYKSVTQEELDKIIKLHEQWLGNNLIGERADFTEKDLTGLSFIECNLSEAIFDRTIMNKCKFYNVKLCSCNMIYTDMKEANFNFVDFTDSYLSSVDMNAADLTHVLFNRSTLENVNMKATSFFKSDIKNSSLCSVDFIFSLFNNCDCDKSSFFKIIMFRCNIWNSYFTHINNFDYSKIVSTFLKDCVFTFSDYEDAFVDCSMKRTIITPSEPVETIVPETGSFIGYKKVRLDDGSCGVVTLEILEDSKRSNGTSRMCRCSKAKVLSIVDEQSNCHKRGYSFYDKDFKYEVGEVVEVENFDDYRFFDCTHGIHFFMTEEEAWSYEA